MQEMLQLCARSVQAGASHELRIRKDWKEMMCWKMRVRSRHLTPLMLLVQVVPKDSLVKLHVLPLQSLSSC